jgi:lipopolysaccharide export system protein LptA
VDLPARSALLEGRVELRRERATLRCQRLELRFDERGQVLWARGAGGVLVETPELRAEAEEATFELERSRVQLRGPVRAQQGGLRLTAAGASVDLFGQQLELSEVEGAVTPPASAP